MIDVIDIIDSVKDRRQRERDHGSVWGVMVHRCGVDLQTGTVLGYHAKAVCDAFCGRVPEWAEVAKVTGSENAYTFLIGGDLGPPEFDGVVWQCLPLDEIGPHGRRFSEGFIGVGCIGDAREKPLSLRQRNSLVDVCAALCDGYDLNPLDRLMGHGEVVGAHDGSKSPKKPAACPGDLLDMDGLRDEVDFMLEHQRKERLAGMGLR